MQISCADLDVYHKSVKIVNHAMSVLIVSGKNVAAKKEFDTKVLLVY